MFQRRHPAFTTAYYCNYAYDSSLIHRTARFRHLPSTEVKHSSNFITKNLHVPKGPHRRLVTDGSAVHGMGTATTIQLSADKPIVRSPRPQEFNRELLERVQLEQLRALKDRTSENHKDVDSHKRSFCDEEVNRLSVQRRWTSTTREATEESALATPRYPVPRTTLEPCADSVRHRAQKYHPEPCVWQQYAREWDTMQVRKPMPALGSQKATITLPEIPSNISMVVQNSKCNPVKKKAACNGTSGSRLDLTATEQQCTRSVPGYGGFVPRHAVEPRPMADEDCLAASMCSTSRRTYRRFPPEEYRELQFAHKGPLSKTVTLTYPFNPFNKLE